MSGRRLLRRAAIVAGLAVCVPVSGQQRSPSDSTIRDALAKISPSLVRIHVVTYSYEEGREVKREASGSGTIISVEGHVLTNHHVAGRTRTLVCTLADREEIAADLVGTDPLSDIAIIKLRPEKPRTFPAARFGDVSKLKVGDPVMALGSPLALSQSVTMGIVSNTEMIMPGMFWPFNRMTLEGEDVGSIVRWIGHDAAIFGGNSGGPLVNLSGEIVGVNEISMGLAGAIPSDLAQEVATALMRDGKVRRAWIGLDVQPLLKSSAVRRGALVGGSVEGSPAAAAGFIPGDVLIKLDGRDVNVRFAEEVPLFNQSVMRLPIGKSVTASVLRGGVERTLALVAEERESVEAPVEEVPGLGITASNLTRWAAKELRRADRKGVRVNGVRPGGPADDAKPALAEDDVIVAIEGKAVGDVRALQQQIDRVTGGSKQAVKALLTFERRDERLLTVVEVGRAVLEDPGLEARKAWVPVSVQVLTRELAEKVGVPDVPGVRVTRVFADGAGSGLNVGDIITAVDGTPVEASQPSDADLFATMIRQYRIGSTVELSVRRGAQEQQLAIKLAASPRLPREMKKYEDRDFEFRVRDLAAADRATSAMPETQPGVLVEAVREGGWAALSHLADGDIILAIDGDTVADVTAVQQKMERVARDKPPSVVMKVRRGIRTFFVELQTGWKRN
ncbi:MAG TPA: PDZ domain-containing protein [Vicinamibacterales bacterium]|nr:PDZ domain-containing protein [Vicinamibacterales bacterium]